MVGLPLGALSVFYGLLIPFALLQFFALLFLPSLFVAGSKPMEVGKAVCSYLLQTVGIVLMTASGITALYGVVSQASVTPASYLALLIIFVTGGITFLWQEHQSLSIDRISRSVPFAIFFYSFKAIGILTSIFALLYLLLTAVLLAPYLPTQWWIMPATILFYGLLVTWCTRGPMDALHFSMSPMAKPPSPPVHPLEKPKPSVVLPKKIAVKKKGMTL